MKLTIGENIKKLRREKDITQEELAEVFGISCQSVSRWETGACYPDMEVIPDIADFFGVTVDKLMGVDKSNEQKDVEECLARFQEAISKGLVYDCIEIAREGVSKYPNNYALLNKLMYVLFVSGDDDGNIPEWHENMVKNDSEITAIGERIMKYCPDQDIRLEATARLAFNHCLQDRKEMGRNLFESLPSEKYGRENNIWWALEENEKESFLRNKIKADYENLRSYIWLLATSGCVSVQDSITALNKVFELEDLISDKNLIKNTWGHAKLNFDLARRYAIFEDFENAFKHLNFCIDAAIAYDERPDEQSYSSVLLGIVTTKRTDVDTSDTRPLCKIVLEDWMSVDEFNSIKNDDEFVNIVNKLRNMIDCFE